MTLLLAAKSQLTRSAGVVLITALAPVCAAQSTPNSGRAPISRILVRGLSDSAGAQIMLINAQGPTCREPVLISAPASGLQSMPADLEARQSNAKTFRTDIGN